MMKQYSYNKILILLILAGLVASLVIDVERHRGEEANNTIELAIDYEGLVELAEREGLPTVAYFADKCCLSSGYFGTLVKTETGRTAKDIINDRILAKAKELLSSRGNEVTLTVSQISQCLGFEYPQHFVRFFKALTGKTPTQWRAA